MAEPGQSSIRPGEDHSSTLTEVGPKTVAMLNAGHHTHASSQLSIELTFKPVDPPWAATTGHIAGAIFVMMIHWIVVTLRAYGVHVLAIRIFDKTGTAAKRA